LKRFVAASFALSAVTGVLAADPAADLALNDFAYGVEVTTTGEAAAYRVALPLAVYQAVVHADLSDVRVFNERGEPVPYRLERPRSQSTAQVTQTPLPLFTLRGDPGKALDAVRVTIEAGNTRVEVPASTRSLSNSTSASSSTARSASSGTADLPVASYVIDARSLSAPVAAFNLSWPADAPDFAGHVRIEASDDLGMWHTVVFNAPIANLHAGDARIIERRAELTPTKAKYWRLSWPDTPATFELTSVTAEPARDQVDVTRETVTVGGNPVAGKRGEFEFDLGAKLPVDRLTLELPEQNSIVEVEMLSRAAPQSTWRHVTRTGFYRLKNAANAELTNGLVAIEPTSDRYWLARVDMRGGGLGPSAPKLRAGWLPHDIVFLARGTGPFTLAYGSSAAQSVAALSGVPTTIAVANAALGEPHALGGAVRLEPVHQKLNFWSKTTVLWTVLAVGVAVLAFMAYRLARELKDKP
jgi:hypothetical protein